MDYLELAEQMMNIRARLSHIPAGTALSEACGGEYVALSFLLSHGGASSPTELKCRMNVSSARIAALLKHLEGKGLVHRLADPSDERRVIVQLTEAGGLFIKSRRLDALSRIAGVLEALGEDDAREYVRLQQRILDLTVAEG